MLSTLATLKSMILTSVLLLAAIIPSFAQETVFGNLRNYQLSDTTGTVPVWRAGEVCSYANHTRQEVYTGPCTLRQTENNLIIAVWSDGRTIEINVPTFAVLDASTTVPLNNRSAIHIKRRRGRFTLFGETTNESFEFLPDTRPVFE